MINSNKAPGVVVMQHPLPGEYRTENRLRGVCLTFFNLLENAVVVSPQQTGRFNCCIINTAKGSQIPCACY